MNKLKDSTPDWLYHQAKLDADLLPQITKELTNFFLSNKNQSLVQMTSTYVEYYDIKTCPTLIQQLQQLDLYTKFLALGFISVDSTKIFPPHVDGDVDCALNIPIVNCEGTYTVWYDGVITDNELPDYAKGVKIAEISRIADPKTVKEIGRCDSSIPHWININTLHRPETTHDRFRVAASLRFYPEPLNEKRELWPHLIKINN
jgi:hypothetical protein